MKCATNDTIAYIKLLAQDLAGCAPDCAVLAVMFDLAIPVNHSGFEYLKAAILLQHEHPTMVLVNDIYLAIAQKHGNRKLQNTFPGRTQSHILCGEQGF